MAHADGKLSSYEYEVRMKEDREFCLREMQFQYGKESTLDSVLKELSARLKKAGISYAVIGALALREHGFVRATTDIDLLMTADGLQTFQSECVGAGFIPAFPGARKRFRHAESGVKIDIIIAGEYPGDGQPKSVIFPDPRAVSFEKDGISFLKLVTLIELKLASGMTAPHRLHDLADVQRLIRESSLPKSLSEQLDESVRSAYLDLWDKAQHIDAFEE